MVTIHCQIGVRFWINHVMRPSVVGDDDSGTAFLDISTLTVRDD